MNDPLVPKDGDAILLCHPCQWRARFAGSVLWMAHDALTNNAKGRRRLIWRQNLK